MALPWRRPLQTGEDRRVRSFEWPFLKTGRLGMLTQVDRVKSPTRCHKFVPVPRKPHTSRL